MLAARLVLDQGVPIEGLNFFTGFCVEDDAHATRNQHGRRPRRNNALWAAEQLGIKLHSIDVIDEYKHPVLNLAPREQLDVLCTDPGALHGTGRGVGYPGIG